MAFLVCGYDCVFSSDLLWRMIVYTLHNYKASHQCGLSDVFLRYLLEGMSSENLVHKFVCFQGTRFRECLLAQYARKHNQMFINKAAASRIPLC